MRSGQGGSSEDAGDVGGSPTLGLPPELAPYESVFCGLYHHLAQASRLPTNMNTRRSQVEEEVMAEMEMSLLKGIRQRTLDLSFRPDRLSSWRGLAECASRLLAIYLDATPPSCHRLGLPRDVLGPTSPSPAPFSTPASMEHLLQHKGRGMSMQRTSESPEPGLVLAPEPPGLALGAAPAHVDVTGEPAIFGLAPLGSDLSCFFQGTALDCSAPPPSPSGAGARAGAGRGVAIAEGLACLARGLECSGNGAADEAASMGADGGGGESASARARARATSMIRGLSARISGGKASQEEWSACIGHASVAAALWLAEQSYAVWAALAEAMLRKAEESEVATATAPAATVAATATDGGRAGRGRGRIVEALREIARCCEEEAYMRYMVARDVWCEDYGYDTNDSTASSLPQENDSCPFSKRGFDSSSALPPSELPPPLPQSHAIAFRSATTGCSEGRGSVEGVRTGREAFLRSSLGLMLKAKRLSEMAAVQGVRPSSKPPRVRQFKPGRQAVSSSSTPSDSVSGITPTLMESVGEEAGEEAAMMVVSPPLGTEVCDGALEG
ncbi:unnamed protein product, partial [Choristocarpus tenellus]